MRSPARVILQRGVISLSLLLILGWLVIFPYSVVAGSSINDICFQEYARIPYFVVSKSVCDISPRLPEMISNFIDTKAGSATQVDYKGSNERSDLDRSTTGERKNLLKKDKIRDQPPKFDEFKHKALTPREKSASVKAGNIMHRLEPTGDEYNYASASKGAKILASNKEAKGTSNILGKDMDKYLMNPCSAEEKFVIIELSEETLVRMVEIANFEHHSSNLKEFEVLGSLVYPTENWVKLGLITSRNVKQSQRFNLDEPKWARYLKLVFLSHYGSEFYCTLNRVIFFGTDAVEQMLEDMVFEQDSKLAESAESSGNWAHEDIAAEGHSELIFEDPEAKHDKEDQSAPFQSKGRVFGDSVLKILMQKVRSLDLNLSILERYIEELNTRYGNTFKEIEEEMAEKTALLKKMRFKLTSILDNQEKLVKDVSDLALWKAFVSLQIDALKWDNAVLRSEMAKIVDSQAHSKNKNLIVLLFTFIFGLLSAIKLTTGFTVNIFTGEQKHEEFCKSKIPLLMFLLNCATVGFILLLYKKAELWFTKEVNISWSILQWEGFVQVVGT